MKIGMLWFDNDPQTELGDKVARAAAYYLNKYGQEPNLCFVHPSMANGGESRPGPIEIRTTNTILPNHFWIGVNHAE